ncbi:hypothetical protein CCM_01851 [Cordyceps militaris CM01]|uniref:Uncharacterized protein n=1 Tax=Cordyceps militaris (strain CM01) TaxID=983644 RepID=G3J7Y0_CORMM|nr:uncharacterized protein CCM_01851 [Cordyceps militaris CM01]EGX97191.1 hypothetical protein CCM_01851 [Cordyceps militaris CM01]
MNHSPQSPNHRATRTPHRRVSVLLQTQGVYGLHPRRVRTLRARSTETAFPRFRVDGWLAIKGTAHMG